MLRPARRRFTLLEMLIVISILAVLAGSVIVTLGDAGHEVTVDLGGHQLSQVREALLRFKRDMGYLPNEGRLQLRDVAGVTGAVLDPAVLPDGFDSLNQWRQWFQSPANMLCLLQRPVVDGDPTAGDPPTTSPLRWSLDASLGHLQEFDPTQRRGWNGPYLSFNRVVWMVLTDGITSDGLGNPEGGGVLPTMPVMPNLQPAGVVDVGGTLIYASGASASELPSNSQQGRPLLLLDAGNDFARVVSYGPDFALTLYSPYQTSPYSLAEPGPPAGPLDDGIFLVR